MRSFCTIITNNYLPFAKTLFQSLKEFDNSIKLFVLVVDDFNIEQKLDLDFISLSDLPEPKLVNNILSKYSQNPNAIRWSLKPILLIHLLKDLGFEKAFYVDSDLCFYSDFNFLYEELGTHSFLLSPHWGCLDPLKSELYFKSAMTDGLYNAGFLGATIKGLDSLYWWANMCLYACEKDKSRGLHDDQAYLNHFPILNPDTKILIHRGCNVADWNRFENIRSLSPEGELILNGFFPLVFIHYTNLGYLVEHDPLLVPYLIEYEKRLQQNGWKGDLVRSAKGFVSRKRLRELSWLDRIVRKLIGKKRFSKFKKWE